MARTVAEQIAGTFNRIRKRLLLVVNRCDNRERRLAASEFFALARDADGSISSGIINVSGPGQVIDTAAEYSAAFFTGNQTSLAASTNGNVILSGTEANPIVIDGTRIDFTEQAAAIAKVADGVVVGSALVELVAEHGKDAPAALRGLTSALADAVHSAR